MKYNTHEFTCKVDGLSKLVIHIYEDGDVEFSVRAMTNLPEVVLSQQDRQTVGRLLLEGYHG